MVFGGHGTTNDRSDWMIMSVDPVAGLFDYVAAVGDWPIVRFVSVDSQVPEYPTDVSVTVVCGDGRSPVPVFEELVAQSVDGVGRHVAEMDTSVRSNLLTPGVYIIHAEVRVGDTTFVFPDPTSEQVLLLVMPDGVPATDDGLAASIVDVARVTGTSATVANILMAQCDLEAVSGRLFATDLDNLNRVDREWVRRAVCYQARARAMNPSMFDSMDVTSTSESGGSASFTSDGVVVAPLAARAIRNVSWMSARTVAPSTRGSGSVDSLAGHIVGAEWKRI